MSGGKVNCDLFELVFVYNVSCVDYEPLVWFVCFSALFGFILAFLYEFP